MNCGYMPWILFQDIVIRAARLVEIKLHGNNKLSRKPSNNWRELCNNDDGSLAETIIRVKDSDITLLTHSVMEGIHLAISLQLSGRTVADSRIPRAGYIIDQETREIVESGRGFGVADYTDHEIVNQQMPRFDTPHTDLDPLATDNTNDNNESISNEPSHDTKPASNFYNENMTLNPIKADLSTKRAVYMIAQYAWDLRRQQLLSFYKDYETNHGHPPPDDIDIDDLPPSVIGAFFMCDGQPAAQFAKMMSTDNRRYYMGDKSATLDDLFPDSTNVNSSPEFDEWFHKINCQVDGFMGRCHDSSDCQSKFYGKFYAFPGIFHTGMKLHNCIGMVCISFCRELVCILLRTSHAFIYSCGR